MTVVLVVFEKHLYVLREHRLVAVLGTENMGSCFLEPLACICDGFFSVLIGHNEDVAVFGVNVIVKEILAVVVPFPASLSVLVGAEGMNGSILKRLYGRFDNGYRQVGGEAEIGNLDVVLACLSPVFVLLTVIVIYRMSVDGRVVGAIALEELSVVIACKVIVNGSSTVFICNGEAVALLEPAGIVAEKLVSVAVGIVITR